MTREIKFKAWDKNNKRWVTNENSISSICLNYDDNTLYVFSRYELVQLTGRKDKKGKEMFEGNLLKVSETAQNNAGVCEIKWNSYYAKFTGVRAGRAMEYSIDWLAEYGEIIGNIFESPELLEAK